MHDWRCLIRTSIQTQDRSKQTMDNEYHEIVPKMSGYLEKKRRKKMICSYKKYWFVLEGRLLLYYKSEDEYNAISPCKGSINLNPSCSIKPCNSNSGVFQIESKTTTITLKAESKEEQHRWMQALMSALNQKNDFRKLNHFRHSIGELSTSLRKSSSDKKACPEAFRCSTIDPDLSMIEKLQRIGAKSYGIRHDLQQSKIPLKRYQNVSYSDESIPSSMVVKSEGRRRKAESVITENEEYGKFDLMISANSVESVDTSSEGIYERIPSSDSVFLQRVIIDTDKQHRQSSELMDNDIYWNRCDAEKIAEQDCYDAMDFNENNIRNRVNKLWIETENNEQHENIYEEAEMKQDQRVSNNYADVGDDYADIGPLSQSRQIQNCSASAAKSTNEDKAKSRFRFSRKSKKEKLDGKKRTIAKSESFLQKMWNMKSKNKKTSKDRSMSMNKIVDKLSSSDDAVMKTLTELQLLLEKQSEEVRQLPGKTRTLKDEEDSELLESEVKKKSGKEVVAEYKMPSTCPSLPPRNQKLSSSSSNNEDEIQNPPTVPPKTKKNINSSAIDNILKDLTEEFKALAKEKSNNSPQEENDNQNKGKVKELIKQFSIGKEEGVELRHKHNWKLKPNLSGSDTTELDRLLEELAKVSTAPIMTPGVTTSMINPEISDKEMLKMVPDRRRRLSDPDYDIPRPHRSLTNLPKKDDNALEATRFFGPILKPSDYPDVSSDRPPTPPADYSNLPSIMPDSLEIESCPIDLSHDERQKASFDSHDYVNFGGRSHHNLDSIGEANYASYQRLSSKYKNDFYHLEDTETKFIDSLEP